MLNLPKKLLAVVLLTGLTSFNTTLDSEGGANITLLDNKTEAYFVPSFANCPANIANVVPNPGNCTASVTWIPPIASGTGTVVVTSNYSPGDSFFPGTHQVIYRATDNSGQTAYCTFTVNVLDTVAPVINVPADITVNADPGSCGAVVTFPYPSAVDNCPAGTGESPLEQNFDGGDDFSTLCYVFNGTNVGIGGNINGSQELETLDLVRFDTRSLLMPITRFNGTGEIVFDHLITKGTGNLINHNSRLTVSLVNTLGVATQIFAKQYMDEIVQTEYIPITQAGNFSVLFEFDTDRNRGDIAFLDNIYVPGFVVADEAFSGSCPAAVLRVVQVGGHPYYSGQEFPVGTTTLRYFSEDANRNFSFNEFNVTVLNNLTPPSGSNENYCEGSPIPQLNANASLGEVVDWYDSPSGGILLHTGNTYTPLGPGNYYVETRNPITGCVSGARTEIVLTEDPKPSPPSVMSPIEYCIGDTASQLTATGSLGNLIQWYNQLTGGTMYATAPTPLTTTAGSTFYYVQQVDATTLCISDRSTVEVIVYSLPTAPSVTSPLEYCIGDVAAEINDSATGTNLQWYDAAVGGNLIPGTTRPDTSTVGQQFYWVTQSITSGSGSCESARTRLTVNINTAPIITNQPSNQSVCENGAVTFTVTASGSSTYQWQMFSGGIWVDLTNTPPHSNTTTNALTITGATLLMDGNRYHVVVSSAAATCSDTTSNDVLLTVTPLPSAPGVTTPVNYCHNDTASPLTATGSNLLWYNSATGGTGSATAPTPSTTTVGSISYWVSQTVTACEGPREEIQVVVNAIPNAPGVTSPAIQCQNAAAIQLTATGSNLLWYNNATGGTGSATAPTPSTATVGDTSYWVSQTVSGCEGPRAEIISRINAQPTLTVGAVACASDLLTYSIDITTSGNTVTTNIPAANVTNTGGNNWTIDNIPSGSNIDITVTITATSCTNAANVTAPNCNCPTVSPPAIVQGNQAYCIGGTVPTIEVSVGANETVDWYTTATGGTAVVTNNTSYQPMEAGLATAANNFYAETRNTVNGCTSNTRTNIAITQNPLPNSPNASAVPYCRNDTATPLTATGTNLLWYSSATGGTGSSTAPTPNTTTVGTTSFWVSQTDANSCEGPRTEIVVTVTALPIVVANATATVINAGDPVTLNGSGANTYIWDQGVTDGDTVNPLTTTTYTVIGTDANGCQNTDSVTIIVTPTSDLRLDKAVNDPLPNVGDVVTFTLTLTNDGPIDTPAGTVINDILPAGFTYTGDSGSVTNGTYDNVSGNWTLPAINNTTFVVLEITAIVNAPTGASGEYSNIAQVTVATNFDPDSQPNNDDGDQSEDDESAVIVVPQVADLEVVNTVTPNSGNPGDTLLFTVEVINNGANDATNVDIENIVPIGFTVTNINNGGAQTGNTINWSVVNISSGTTTVLTFEVTINVPTNTSNEYFNTVQVVLVDQFDSDSAPNNDDGDQSEDDEDNASIVLIPADLSLTKTLSTSSDPTPNAGDTITFELTITNEGPGVATNVSIEDRIPSGYTLGTVNNSGTIIGSTIVWNIASIPVGSQVLSYEVTINAPVDVVGEYTNTAQVMTSDQFDPDSFPNNDDGDQSEDDEAAHALSPPTVDLEVGKSVDKSQTFYGDTILFTVTVTNNSTYDATNIGIEDVLPSGYALISHVATAGAYAETISTWEIPVIAIGETVSLEMTVTVTDIDDYTNIAQLIYVDQIDPNMDNDRAEAAPEITQSECLTIFNEFSPNNDGANDFFFIECIEQYPNNLLQVFNRWGTKVFEMEGYNNSWDGNSSGRATISTSEKLPVGTYYYLLELGEGQGDPKSGWLYISR